MVNEWGLKGYRANALTHKAYSSYTRQTQMNSDSTKEKCLKWEKPALVDLGGHDQRVHGGVCEVGSGVVGGCKSGISPMGGCSVGTIGPPFPP